MDIAKIHCVARSGSLFTRLIPKHHCKSIGLKYYKIYSREWKNDIYKESDPTDWILQLAESFGRKYPNDVLNVWIECAHRRGDWRKKKEKWMDPDISIIAPLLGVAHFVSTPEQYQDQGWMFGSACMYNKHTNFALEAIEQPFNTQVAFGSDVQVTLNRTGDLIPQTSIGDLIVFCVSGQSRVYLGFEVRTSEDRFLW